MWAGVADFHKDWHVTVAELEVHLSTRVKELTAGAQTPVTAKPASVPDYNLVRIRRDH